MTNAEAIRTLRNAAWLIAGSFPRMAESAAGEKIEKAVDMAVKALIAQEWIPCKERLPEDEQLVLVTYKTTDRLHICRYHDDGSRNQWYSLNDMCRAYNNVVLAWKPLPEPYREDGDGDEDR